jgi:putative spermidine/putrescine transport system substrate-binding protein
MLFPSKKIILATFTLLCQVFFNGCGRHQVAVVDLTTTTWADVTEKANDTTVRMMMWDGDPAINEYMRGFVKRRMKSDHGIHVEFIGGHGAVLVNRLMVELDAGKTVGDIDLMWINGETFFQLRQINALFGPFTSILPNNQYIDWDDPFIAIDFQQPVDGYECPWGNVQQALIYHGGRVQNPPRNKTELAQWVRDNPGRFTIDNGFTGMTFLKALLYDFAGGPGSWDGDFDEEKYLLHAKQLWEYLIPLRPFLWRKGETYPEGVAQLHQLMLNGEVDFSMSNNDGEVDNKVMQGILPYEARAYVLDTGTIRNSHYLGIPINAPNKFGAMVLANFLISPEAQLLKSMPEVWGDGSVLDTRRLPMDFKQKFTNIPGRARVASREALVSKALAEPAPEIMLRLHADFRKYMIQGE